MPPKHQTKSQVIISRLPYIQDYDPNQIVQAAQKIDERGLICLSVPIVTDEPHAPILFSAELLKLGFHMVAFVAWRRDRFVVTTKSRRLTNCWEPLFIFSKSPKYVINRYAAQKLKKGWEGKELTFDEDQFLTCVGDHWMLRNDRRDRRFLPAMIVMNCAQLADLKPGDAVLDLYGNPSIRETCQQVGWKYVDAGYPSNIRGVKKKFDHQDEG